MQKLQLYIGTDRVDLFKDETVSFTQTIQNVKDIKKIFTEFSKTFSLPASKVNNKIFKHYYNFDIQGGFDARNKVAGKIELNTLPFKEGFIKLEGVDLKKNVAHTYRITFFGNTINLVDVLGDDQLSALPQLSTYNVTSYNETDVKNKMTANLTDSTNICVPLITHTQRLFYNSASSFHNDDGNVYYHNGGTLNGVKWNQLKYALRLQAIIDAIEAQYSEITFSNDFFNNTANKEFHNLWLWLHRKKGSVEPTGQTSLVYNQVTDYLTQTGNTGFSTQIFGFIEIITPTSPTQIIETKLTMTPSNNSVVYNIQIFKNSTLYDQRLNVTGQQILFNTSSTQLSGGIYSVQIGTLDTNGVSFTAGNIKWELSFGVLGQGGGGGTDTYANQNTVSSSATLPFIIVEQIPEMKIIDFLTSLFQMFNLTAFIDNTGTIVVKTLDSFYASGSLEPIVIDEYLDVTKQTSNVALPFKEIRYAYKGLGTFLAKQFNQLQNRSWGTLKYNDNQSTTFDAPNKVYTIEIPFEHVLYERFIDGSTGANKTPQYGYFVDDNRESYYGLPLIFYAIEISNGDNIALSDAETPPSTQAINDYIIPSNSLEVGTGNERNINFNAEVNEYDGNEFTRTLFNNNYSTYITNVFNAGRRLVKVDAVLPQKIFHNLQLNDLIQIRQQNYQINSITTNLTNGKSQLELLNVGNPYFRSLENITYQGTGGGILYYNFSIGVATSITVGDTMFTNQTLTTTASSGIYSQNGSATDDTVCVANFIMAMTLDSNGIITNLICGQP